MNKKHLILLLCTVLLLFTACESKNENVDETNVKEEKIQIGLSFDSFVIERWQKDRDVFVTTAEDLGAEVNVQNANGDVEEQISQIEYFIDKKMDVIVVIAVDSEACQAVIKKAKDAGIKIVAYDRLLIKSNADLYISFDNEEVGRMMAKTLTEKIPEDGKIITIFGPTTDNNVKQMEQGFNEVMQEHDITVVYTINAKGWLAEEAFQAIHDGLNIAEDIDGVLCGNDNLATQAVRALSENRLAGKVVVTGQDADLAACQRIVEGTQTMTVYKPVHKLAKAAAEYAVKLAKGEKIEAIETIDDGKYEVPFVKLEPIAVTRENIDDVIINGDYQIRNEVYLNVPQDTTE